MIERGFCVLHLEPRRLPDAPDGVRLPEEGEWETALAFAAERAVTWWDRNPVFARRQDAERYARLAPVATEVLPVEYTEEERDEEEGWFDSFRSPHRFRPADA